MRWRIGGGFIEYSVEWNRRNQQHSGSEWFTEQWRNDGWDKQRWKHRRNDERWRKYGRNDQRWRKHGFRRRHHNASRADHGADSGGDIQHNDDRHGRWSDAHPGGHSHRAVRALGYQRIALSKRD
jgi:hypothetical protein